MLCLLTLCSFSFFTLMLLSPLQDWELGMSANSSDASSLCNVNLSHFTGLLGKGGGDVGVAASMTVTTEAEAMEKEDEDSDWDMLSQAGSDWDIVSEVDMDAC